MNTEVAIMDDWFERIQLIEHQLIEHSEELLQLVHNGVRCITVNSEIALILLKMARPDFDLLFRGQTVCTVDGIGFRLLLRLLRDKWYKPLRGASLCEEYLQTDIGPPVPICVVGGSEKAQAVLSERFDRKAVVVLGGAFSQEGEPEDPEFARSYLETDAAIDLVALGFPKGEWVNFRLADYHPDRLRIQVGGGIEFAAGTVRRAPRWIQHLGLEWLFRLLAEPSRWQRTSRCIGVMSLILLANVLRQRWVVPRLIAWFPMPTEVKVPCSLLVCPSTSRSSYLAQGVRHVA